MHNPYDLHSWSKLYREEALQEIQTRYLTGRLRANRRMQPDRGRADFAWGMLASLRGARFAGSLEPGKEER